MGAFKGGGGKVEGADLRDADLISSDKDPVPDVLCDDDDA